MSSESKGSWMEEGDNIKRYLVFGWAPDISEKPLKRERESGDILATVTMELTAGKRCP